MTEDQERSIHQYLNRELTSAHVAGRKTQETCRFRRNFFRRYSAGEIPEILSQWKLAEHIRVSCYEPIVVTADGLWRPNGERRV